MDPQDYSSATGAAGDEAKSLSSSLSKVALVVIAATIASLTFQAAANPPPTLWTHHGTTSFKLKPHLLSCRQATSFNDEGCMELRFSMFVYTNTLSFLTAIAFMIQFSYSNSKKFLVSMMLVSSLCFLMLAHLLVTLSYISDEDDDDDDGNVFIPLYGVLIGVLSCYPMLIKCITRLFLSIRGALTNANTGS